jgi:hypothetical protein
MEGLENTFSDLAAFSLNNLTDDGVSDSTKINYYYFLIYAGIALLVILIGVYVYKYFSNRKKVHFDESNNSVQHVEQQEHYMDDQ